MKQFPGRCVAAFFLLLWTGSPGVAAREFSVLVYNVENLFDVDGVALFGDYQDATWNPDNPYTPARLYTKLDHIARVLASIGDGAGPEVVMFQEFELDRTPFGSRGEPAALLERWAEQTVAEMLGPAFDAGVANLPVDALLWKLLRERGLGAYFVAKPYPSLGDDPPAHTNVVFSRFPILEAAQRPMEDARDLQIVTIEVAGQPFTLLNNHWKSGASNPATAGTRRQNAQVVRAALDEILTARPEADVLVAGDLNSHYNQGGVFPAWRPVGVNDILGSQTDEWAVAQGEGPDLYNLWGELPLAERGSEVYRGRWGTLMQMLITPGLYDGEGIQYVDNSFRRVILPGENVDLLWGRPRSWISDGDGVGYSDHLPILARFRALEEGNGEAVVLHQPTREAELLSTLPVVDYGRLPAGDYPRAERIAQFSAAERTQAYGQLFHVRGRKTEDGRGVLVNGVRYGLYLPGDDVLAAWRDLEPGARVRFVGEFGNFRGTRQFILHHESWWR